MSPSTPPPKQSASELISQRIADLADWRGATLARMRQLIHQADPEVVEEWKWMGTPVWSHDGILCTGESYKDKVKLTFAKGAALADPAGLFNASLDGNARRAIDIHVGEEVDAAAFVALLRAAVALNRAGKAKAPKKKNTSAPAKPAPTMEPTMPPDVKAKGPASYFPSIEKTYGQPIAHWLGLVSARQDLKHMALVAWLKSEHGLGHGHANAIVAHVLAARAG